MLQIGEKKAKAYQQLVGLSPACLYFSCALIEPLISDQGIMHVCSEGGNRFAL